MTDPIEMSFADFVGPFEIMDSALPTHHHWALSWKRGEVLSSSHLASRGYTLHRVLYSPHPDDHARILKKRGEAVIARIADTTVGGAREGYVWVHDKHSRIDDLCLASEMGIAWFKLTRELGTDWRLSPESRDKHGTDKLTMPGLKFRIRQYTLMVERNILSLPKGAALPTLETVVPRSQIAKAAAWSGRRERRMGRWSK